MLSTFCSVADCTALTISAQQAVNSLLNSQVRAVCRYACYYLTRNSLTYTAPVMTADPALKMDITQVGTMTSIFPIAYGFSKFLSGVLGARTSPRVMLAGGLMATAVVNILFGFGSSMVWFCSFWALNGILQVRSFIYFFLVHLAVGQHHTAHGAQCTCNQETDSCNHGWTTRWSGRSSLYGCIDRCGATLCSSSC